MIDKKRVLFVCTENRARSQMAEAILRKMAPDRFEVRSAGSDPAVSIHPLAVEVLKEAGIEVGGARPKNLADFLDKPFDYVITLCGGAREVCPVFPGGGRTYHWDLEDPAAAEGSREEKLSAFRRIRDEISSMIGDFLEGF